MSVGPIFLGDLREGCCRELTRREVEALYKRCLPEDPVRPTVRQVRETLTVCFERAVRRQHTKARPVQHSISGGCSESNERGGKGEQDGVSAIQTRPDTPIRSGAVGARRLPTEAAGDRRHPRTRAFVCEVTKDEASGIVLVEGLVGNVLSYSLGDLHEAPEGLDGECGLPELCPGEGDSLRHAQAIPPNEDHMVCGYRKSQIERLPQ